MARRTLLVVEDDEDLRTIFRTALSVAGFDVREAVDGLDALRRIDAGPPDALILDLGLPYVSGFGVLYDLSVQAETQRIPVIVVTGSSDPLDHLNVACVLRKPVMPDQLVATVRRCIQQSRGTPAGT
jgi:DNA-binding response OmpR family regulator